MNIYQCSNNLLDGGKNAGTEDEADDVENLTRSLEFFTLHNGESSRLSTTFPCHS
jgi:hypothetical protein